MRIGIPIGRGIPLDRATFVLCSTQDLNRDEGEVRVRRKTAWESEITLRTHSLGHTRTAVQPLLHRR